MALWVHSNARTKSIAMIKMAQRRMEGTKLANATTNYQDGYLSFNTKANYRQFSLAETLSLGIVKIRRIPDDRSSPHMVNSFDIEAPSTNEVARYRIEQYGEDLELHRE